MTNSILIVDQNETDGLLLQKTLRDLGVLNPIHMMLSGAEALAYLKGVGPYSDRTAFPYPAVTFVDLKLPNMAGWHILDYIKTSPSRKKAMTFAYTESMSVSDVRRLYSLGANSYVAKPTTDVELLRLLYQFPEPWQFASGRNPMADRD